MLQRFLPISDREMRSSIPAEVWRAVTENYSSQHWRGVAIDKSPFELALYPMLIQEFRFATVIEIGTGAGGSALWLSDNARLTGDTHVVTLDRDVSPVDSSVLRHPHITFLEGDCADPEKAFPPDLLAILPHPWLVVEDAHESMVTVLDYLDRAGFADGDYLIIEDTNSDLWEAWTDWPDKPFLSMMQSKYTAVIDWLSVGTRRDYRADSRYLDLFGYNACKQWNTMLRVF